MQVPFLDVAGLHAPLRDEFAAVTARVIDANHLVLGSECTAFEAEFAAYTGTEYGVGVGNGLEALRFGLEALGVGPGDEVIVPGQTFIASWLAVSTMGATPVAVDVSLENGQIDPQAVEAAIGPATAGIMAVDLYGAMAPMVELQKLADRHGLALIEDAAQAHGARLAGRPAGSFGDFAGFSFYPGKNLGALGDAGALVTSRADIAERAQMLRNYGSRKKYEHEIVGGNSRLDELQAAFLRVKLPLLLGWNRRRREIAARYGEALAERVGVLSYVADSEPVHHLFPIRVPDRDRVQGDLAAAGVQTGIHYPSTPAQAGAYAGAGYPFLPASEQWAREELSLPIGPTMTDAQVEYVIRTVLDVVPPA